MIPAHWVAQYILKGLSTEKPDGPQVIAEYRHSVLADYTSLKGRWFGGWLEVEHQLRLSDRAGNELMQQKAAPGDGRVKGYATCPADGALTLLHRFDTQAFVPIGHTPYRLEQVLAPRGQQPQVFTGTLDGNGQALIQGCQPDQRYRVRFYPDVGEAEFKALYASYDGVLDQLQGWLLEEWQRLAPRWDSMAPAGDPQRFAQIRDAFLEGFSRAFVDLFDDLKSLIDLLSDLQGSRDRLLAFLSEQDLQQLAARAGDLLDTALSLLNDEPLMFIYATAITCWVQLLPPVEIAGMLGAFSAGLLVDVLFCVVLGGGVGLAVRASLKGLKRTVHATTHTDTAMAAMQRLIAISQKHALNSHVQVARPLLMRGDIEINSSAKIPVQVQSPAQGIDRELGKTVVLARGKRQPGHQVDRVEPLDDAPHQGQNPNGQPACAANATQTDGCPVSMVTGEELLTLTDAHLGGALPFEWTRLYRTSAVEVDHGLGFGWSHALAHRLQFDAQGVLWTDHENRQLRLPRPDRQRPQIHNSLAQAAIFLGSERNELILAQAGPTPRYLHFIGEQLTKISDAYGNHLVIQRGPGGRIERVINGTRHALCLRYEQRRLIAVDLQQLQPDGDFSQDAWLTLHTPVRYQYNQAGQLIAARNALDETEQYRYDARHVIVERQLAGGAAFYWAWEREGRQARCVRHWASFAQIDTHYDWDDKGGVTARLIDGSEQHYQHDVNARLVRQVDPDGAEHHKVYDAKGQLIAERNPLGVVTEYRHNEAGQLMAVLPGDGEPTFYRYHAGFVSQIQRGQAIWKYQRNVQGDVFGQTDPHGHITSYVHDPQGRLIEIRHPDGGRHHLRWNKDGHLCEEHLPDGRVHHYRYDALGRQIAREEQNGAITRYQWDAANRLTHITAPGAGTRSWSYNAYGHVTSECDALGRVTRYEYADGLHLLTRRINPDGSQLRYRYDNARLLLTDIENERGEHYRLDYHANGLIRQETGFDGQRCAYAYDLNGHLLEKTEFGDDDSTLVTRYQRDGTGRLLCKTLPDGQLVHYHYDRLGRLIEVDDGAWPMAWEYDLGDRLTREYQGAATLRYGYDKSGRLNHCRLPDHNTLDYRYQPGGDLQAILLNDQRLTSHQYQGGHEVARLQGTLLSRYAYDEQGRLTAHLARLDGEQRFSRQYQYQPNGNLAAVQDSRTGLHRFEHDPLDRLQDIRGDRQEGFVHDPAGNLLAQSAFQAYPRERDTRVQGNRLLRHGDTRYDYDAFGNLIRERHGREQPGSAPLRTTEYRYDCQHRLIEVHLPDGKTAEYRYDAFGRRVAKVIDGRTTEFFWQGEHLIVESSRDHHRSYVYEPGTFRPLALLDGHGPEQVQVGHYHLDHLGTPQDITDAHGELLWSARLRAYGSVAMQDVAKIDNPLRFQGQYFDAETGLHYNRNRYYNPRNGRYLTPDPIRLAGGLNAYQYVPDPTGWVDPLGLASAPGGCPGGKGGAPAGQNPAAGATVNTGQPSAPAPQLSPEQRREEIEKRTEANAKRRVQGYEKKYNMHTIGKHSPEIPDAVMKQRAIDGRDPITGKKGKLNRSSQFNNWKLQMNVINEALTRIDRGLPPFTGRDHNQNPIVEVESSGTGRGYKPNKKDPSNPKLNNSMNNAEVKFDKNDSSRPFTAFPSE